jgi:hypothetical protein
MKFMIDLAQLVARRNEIVGEIHEIKSMRKGVLNIKYQQVKHKNGEIATKGPYYVLTKKGAGGKTISKSIPAKDAPRIREEVDNYKRFRQLSDEYVEVCEKISIFYRRRWRS